MAAGNHVLFKRNSRMTDLFTVGSYSIGRYDMSLSTRDAALVIAVQMTRYSFAIYYQFLSTSDDQQYWGL